jgi:hypothetical protein
LKISGVRSRTSKIAAARRQLDAAIRMFFVPEDSLAVQAVTSAAERILRDLAEHSAKSSIHEIVELYVRKGMEKQFWACFNESGSALKEANTEPGVIFEFDELSNGMGIFSCCLYYQRLGLPLTPDMRGFIWWYSLMNPELFVEAAPIGKIYFQPDFERIRSSPRELQLVFGKRLCAIVKKMGG